MGSSDAAPASVDPQMPSPFDSLPPEMLSAVLARLDSETLLVAAPAVCTRWRAMCREFVPAVFEFVGVRVFDGVLRAIGA